MAVNFDSTSGSDYKVDNTNPTNPNAQLSRFSIGSRKPPWASYIVGKLMYICSVFPA